MRLDICKYYLGTVALISLTVGAAPVMAQSTPAATLPADREEIIITHQRLGPLSDWAAMQQHSADYRRLKAKYDPTTGSSHTDDWASDRHGAGPTSAVGGFEAESAAAETPPAVQAIKDAVVPP